MTSHFWNDLKKISTKIGLIILLLVCGSCFVKPLSGYAQTREPDLRLIETDKKDFPRISLTFEIRNATATQLADPIKASDISILEGKDTLKAAKVDSTYVGTHFMLAVNTARTLALVDQNRVSNYEKLIGAIKTLGSQLAPESGDHFSFFINPDSEWRELGNFSEWLTAIDSYEDIYGMRRLEHSFTSLDKALDAFEITGLDQETVLVYIMPYVPPRETNQLFERIERAGQLGLPLHIWMVLEYSESEVPYENELREKLETNGGSLTLFHTASENLPDPKSYLEGMGYIYTLEYESAIRTTETVELAIQIKTTSLGSLKSDSKDLSVVVEPAQLQFRNLTNELTIQLDKEKNPAPRELPLEVSIEFIDNYPREIVSTSLWIDGVKAQENKQAPYGSFLIDLKPYQESVPLKVEVRLDDIWGVQGSTGTQTIKLNIVQPETFLEEVSRGVNIWLILAVGLGGLIIIAAIFLPNLRKKSKQATVESAKPPVDATPAETTGALPVKKGIKKPGLFGKLTAKKTPKEASTPSGETPAQSSPELSLPPARHYGSLLKLDQDSTPSAVRPFLLTKPLIYIGRDPKIADLVLDDPAIDPLHAELRLYDDGRATLTDFKTTAGTYRNYKALTANATPLQHGDILHFGTIMYRFHSATRTSSPSETKADQTENIRDNQAL